MVVESRPQLELVNQGVITPEGKMAHALALADQVLSDHMNPTVTSAISPAMIESYRTERDRQMQNLGIEEGPDAAEKISQIRSLLEEQGILVSKMVDVPPHSWSSRK